MRPQGIDMFRGATYGRKRSGEIGDPWGVPTETGEESLREPWTNSVQVLSDRKEDTQSTIYEGRREASSLALRVEALKLSKLALMSKKRVETSSLALWRVFISGVRARQASEELSPSREPHWVGWRSPLDLAMADSLTVITRSRILGMVLRRTMIQTEAGESFEALPGLSRTTALAVFNEGGCQPKATREERRSWIIAGLMTLTLFHTL